jgi:hypothetical protein
MSLRREDEWALISGEYYVTSARGEGRDAWGIKRGEDGECPVLAMEHEQLWVAYPGFDFYVAHEVGEQDVRALAEYAELTEKAAVLCGLEHANRTVTSSSA